MAKELRFTDPAFTCEVVLAGPCKALYDAAQPEFERLKGIRSLGIKSYTSDIAWHPRHTHLVGLLRIFNKLCQQPQGRGLPRDFIWSFWCRLCFGQTGHAALSYDAEKAVVLSCHLSAQFRDKFRALIQPVVDCMAKCPVCSKCTVQATDREGAAAWFDDLVQKNRWDRVYLWIAALKLLRSPKILEILRSQQQPGNSPRFSEPEAIKILVAPGCVWDRRVSRLNRLDYVVRDLAFAGTLGIQLDIDGLVASANEDRTDWKLLGSIGHYLSETLYESIEAETASALFQRALASLLISGKVSLETLFGLPPQGAFDDDRLASVLRRTRAGREVFDAVLRTSWRTWTIRSFVDPERTPSDVEKGITGQNSLYLAGHTKSRVTCFRLGRNASLALSMSHRGASDRPEVKAFVKLCRSILIKQYPRLAPEDIRAALLEGLVDRACNHGLQDAVKRYAEVTYLPQSMKRAAVVVNRKAATGSATIVPFSVKIGGFDYPLRGDPQGLQINVMHAALMGDDSVRRNLDMTIPKAMEILWSEILDWQSVYFGLRPSKKILGLLGEAQNRLAGSVLDGSPSAQADLERYTLLEALRHPDRSVSFRVALPNVVLLKEDGNKENEYDAVSVVLKEDRDVEVWIWGATTQKDIQKKRSDDLSKINKLRDSLGERWGSSVKTVVNYIHVDGEEICCDINGHQERRARPQDS